MLSQTLPDNTTYDYLFRTSSDGILIADAQGLVEQVNPAAAAMLGVTAELLLNKPPSEAFSQNHALRNLFMRDGDQTLEVHLPRRRQRP